MPQIESSAVPSFMLGPLDGISAKLVRVVVRLVEISPFATEDVRFFDDLFHEIKFGVPHIHHVLAFGSGTEKRVVFSYEGRWARYQVSFVHAPFRDPLHVLAFGSLWNQWCDGGCWLLVGGSWEAEDFDI